MNLQRGWAVPWKTVSLSTIIAALPVMIGVNHAYVNWHNDFGNARWAKKQEMVLAQTTMASNSEKLDRIADAIAGIQIQTAITMASEFRRQLDLWKAKPQGTAAWIAERDRLERQLERAIEYKNCLIDQKSNCDRLRGW